MFSRLEGPDPSSFARSGEWSNDHSERGLRRLREPNLVIGQGRSRTLCPAWVRSVAVTTGLLTRLTGSASGRQVALAADLPEAAAEIAR